MTRTTQKSRSYQDLDVWRLSINLVKEIYRVIEKFPSWELYVLSSQIRKAAISIPSNIAEGQGRNSSREFRQYLAVSLGSLSELETQLIIAQEIGYLSAEEELNPLLISIDTIRKMLRALSNSLHR